MLKKIARGMEKWGHYLLALLCAGVILLSAVWTRDQQAREQTDQAALADRSQRLTEAEKEVEEVSFARPVSGAAGREFSEAPVYFPDTGVWQSHPALDFAAGAGEAVCAMAPGTVVACGDGQVTLDHGNDTQSLYRGLATVAVRQGQQVRRGETLGTAGERVLFEGTGHVCVRVTKNGLPVPFSVSEK